MGKIVEKAAVGCIFDNIALYFEWQSNKYTLFHTVFFGDFAHWEEGQDEIKYFCAIPHL